MHDRPLLRRPDLTPFLSVVLLALTVPVGTAIYTVHTAAMPISSLGVFFDGHLYLEIARSFPAAYAPEGFDYLGQPPGYPALAWLFRGILPDALVNWGLTMLLASWLPAAASAGVFYLVCREAELSPFWPAVLFVVGNPRWVSITASPHPEPLALLCAVSCLLAYLRGHTAWACLWLAGAIMARYPAVLLGIPLAFGVLVLRREFTLRRVLLVATPLVPLGLLHLYLYLRVPGFPGIWEVHRVFWDVGPTWPFNELYQFAARWLWPQDYRLFDVTYGSLGLYLLAIAVGFRRRERNLWILPIWVAVLLLFHVSLSGDIGAWDFTRLVVLAWPAALVILSRWVSSADFWSRVEPRLRHTMVGVLALAAASLGPSFATRHHQAAIRGQLASQPFLREKIRSLDSDEPRWVNFHGARRRQPSESR